MNDEKMSSVDTIAVRDGESGTLARSSTHTGPWAIEIKGRKWRIEENGTIAAESCKISDEPPGTYGRLRNDCSNKHLRGFLQQRRVVLRGVRSRQAHLDVPKAWDPSSFV
jgi:hypothetical protein